MLEIKALHRRLLHLDEYLTLQIIITPVRKFTKICENMILRIYLDLLLSIIQSTMLHSQGF